MNTNKNTDKIYFRNQNQVTLFRCELQGQLSDGNWENSLPRDHYRRPCDATVLVAQNDTELGCTFAPLRKYNFANADLLAAVGDRMLFWVRFTKAFPETINDYDKHWHWESVQLSNHEKGLLNEQTYSMSDLKKDLKDMSVIFNTMHSGRVKEAPKTDDKQNATVTLAQVKEKLHADTYSVKNGVFTLRWGFYYTHGVTAEHQKEKVLKAFPDCHILEAGEVWKAFRGGASVANQSHWFVKFTF